MTFLSGRQGQKLELSPTFYSIYKCLCLFDWWDSFLSTTDGWLNPVIELTAKVIFHIMLVVSRW